MVLPKALLPVLVLLWVRSASGLRTAAHPRTGQTDSKGWELCAAPAVEGVSPGDATVQIPKIVHMTYKSATLPPRLAAYRSSWQHQLPDWEHKLWLDEDNRNLVKEHYSWFLPTYDGYDKTIKRVDAARIFMLHRYGGIYADTDVEVLQDPRPLFAGHRDLFFFAQVPLRRCGPGARVSEPQDQESAGAIPNALMASVPGHPFWVYLAMKLMSSRHESLVMRATGPSRLTESLSSYQVEHPQARVAIFQMDYWSPFKWGEGGCVSKEECAALYPNAYTISHWTGTWNHCESGTCLQSDELRSKFHRSAEDMPSSRR